MCGYFWMTAKKILVPRFPAAGRTRRMMDGAESLRRAVDKDSVHLALGKHFGHPVSRELAIVMTAILALPKDDRCRIADACEAFFCPRCGQEDPTSVHLFFCGFDD
jgi:hypothetical protein